MREESIVSSHLLATGFELPTDYSFENPSDLTQRS